MRVAVPAIVLLLSGCSLAFGPEGAPEDDGGSFSPPPGGSSPGEPPANDDPIDVTATEVTDVELDSTCDEGSTSNVTLAPLASGGLGSVQYSRAALEAKRWPDGSNLSVDDFRAYFSDKSTVIEPRLAARFSSSSDTDGVLSLRFRLPRPQGRAPLHIVAVADVSLSAADLASFREAVLTDLAVAVDRSEGDRLSLVSYGDSPEVLFEAPVAEAEQSLKAVTGDKGLPGKDGNNLGAAIERAASLLAGEHGHIVVLSDGGQAINDNIGYSVASARAAGHLVSAVQFAAPLDNGASPNATLFYNGALLGAIASRGGGSHLYANELLAADGDQTALAARYEELFAIAASDVSVTVTLPPGVTSTLPVPGPGEGGLGVSVSAVRGFGVDVPVVGCAGAFDPAITPEAVESEMLVSVKAGDVTLIDRQSITFASALSNSNLPTLDNAIVATVTALRQRDVKSIQAAFTLVTNHHDAVCAGQTVVPQLCAIAEELDTFLRGICPLVSVQEVTACGLDL
jgi:hypothetical protein